MNPLIDLLNTILTIFDLILPILLASGVLVFLWGLVKFIYNADNESEHERGRNLMIWGMIALFVMVAFWGIIGFLQDSFGITGSISAADAPSVKLIPKK